MNAAPILPLILPVVLPLIAAAAVAAGPWAGPGVRRIAILAGAWLPLTLLLPLVLGARGEAAIGTTIVTPIVLLGLRLGVDAPASALLLLTAIVWTLAGWFALARVRRRPGAFWFGWLIALAGMALTLLAQDLAGFYLGYATVSLASWLLVIHARNAEAWRAGRVYLVLALAGEMAIFAGVIAIAAAAGNVALDHLAALQPGPLVHALLLAGFAVKMGILPLHLWLPLAHPVAPVPASAILSGVIVKAGLLGWLRLVPPGSLVDGVLPDVLLVLGAISAFGGVALGLVQTRMKVVLAYSTISQMGLVLCLYAALLGNPHAAEALLPWLGVLVLHHGLNKGALFLACGCAPGRSVLRGVLAALPALALAGAPLTTGMLAKSGIKSAFTAAGLGHGWLLMLSLSSTATALLLWRFWTLLRAEQRCLPAHPAWIALTLAALVVPWSWSLDHRLTPDLLHALWPSTWPLLIAAALIAGAGVLRRAGRAPQLPVIPAGDLVVPLERLAGAVIRALARPGIRPSLPNLYPLHVRLTRGLIHAERKMTALPGAGILILAVGGLLWWVLWQRP